MAAALTGTEDLTGTCWRDDVWLSHYGIHPANALDYFSMSPFYDRTCNNELAKLRGIRPEHLP
jgi:mediator of RNA polymerase II transcription subunit 6